MITAPLKGWNSLVDRGPRIAPAIVVLVFGLGFGLASVSAAPPETESGALFRKGDRVAWIGSSSTRIGIWPQTVEFLLRTRHPELGLTFQRFTTGGGTFATGLQHLDAWLGEFHPTVVVFNYGGNDARGGRAGLPKLRDEMARCVDRARRAGARVALVTPQPADPRASGVAATARQALYAETMLNFGRTRGWTVIDTHHPLERLRRAGQRADSRYTILKDKIHLTGPAYVAWGAWVFDRLDLPPARSVAAVSAAGTIESTVNCEVEDVKAAENDAGGMVLSFLRHDRVLPILPPGILPPRFSVPLESNALYMLAVTGLPEGEYEIRCENATIGVVAAESLAEGVNLNTILLDAERPAPWGDLARAIWEGDQLDKIGKTNWRFEVRRAQPGTGQTHDRREAPANGRP